MASTLFEKLNNIEKGRQNCIKNAKLANLPATDNMSVYDLGELFLQQNNTEFINPNNPAQGGGWQRPSDWWDTKTILQNAEDRDGLKPAYILLMANTDLQTNFTEVTTYKNLQGDGFLTSDGAWYLKSNGAAIHTWDETKDKPCSEGYKTRYVIVYVSNPQNINKILLQKDFPCLEAIFGNITLQSDGFAFGEKNSSNANGDIKSVECLEDTIFQNGTISVNTYGTFQYCYSLVSVNLPTLTKINSNLSNYVSSFSGGIFQNCSSLVSVNLPALTEINSSGYSSGTFQSCSSLVSITLPALTKISNDYRSNMATNGGTFQGCHSLVSVNLPVLIEINSSNYSYGTFQGCYSLVSVNLPALTKINNSENSGGAFQQCYSLVSVNLPALTKISNSENSGGTFQNCSSLVSVNLPALTEINNDNKGTFQSCSSLVSITLPALTRMSGVNTFQYCYSLVSINLPALTTISGSSTFQYCSSLTKYEFTSTLLSITVTNIFNYCYALKNIVLFADWDITGLNVTDCNLTRDSLNDMLYKLKDVTGESGTYTLTLGATNLAKLTSAEIAVGTDKGWTIA